MQEQGEDRTAHGRCARRATAVSAPEMTGVLHAGRVAGRNALTLPTWFPAAKARAVLRLKGIPFALLSDARGAYAAVHVDELAIAPPERSLSGCATSLGPAVAETLPIDEAVRLMNRQATAYLPVVLGGAVLGVLSHAAVTAALEAAAYAPMAPSATFDPCQ